MFYSVSAEGRAIALLRGTAWQRCSQYNTRKYYYSYAGDSFNLLCHTINNVQTKISIVLEGRKRILVAVLDWGLGHATRCMPIIKALQAQGAEVQLAGSGASLALLRQQFSALKAHNLSAYNPTYPANTNMVWAMAGQLPKFVKAIAAEQKELETIVEKEGIDVVISDNRYGCHSKRAKCYIIAHQLNILMPQGWAWMQPIVNRFNHAQLAKFDGVWCPANDATFPEKLLQGHDRLNTRFIGFLSRLQPAAEAKQYAVAAICSGPEPQRGLLEGELTKQLSRLAVPSILVAGRVAKSQKSEVKGNLRVVNYMGSEELNKLMAQSTVIVARSGYSTVMDMMRMGNKAIFVPTPGQTEQEYLAEALLQQGIAYSVPQGELDIQKALKQYDSYAGFGKFATENDLLTQAVSSIL